MSLFLFAHPEFICLELRVPVYAILSLLSRISFLPVDISSLSTLSQIKSSHIIYTDLSRRCICTAIIVYNIGNVSFIVFYYLTQALRIWFILCKTSCDSSCCFWEIVDKNQRCRLMFTTGAYRICISCSVSLHPSSKCMRVSCNRIENTSLDDYTFTTEVPLA